MTKLYSLELSRRIFNGGLIILLILALGAGLASEDSWMFLFVAYSIGWLLSFNLVVHFHKRGQVGWKNISIVFGLVYTLFGFMFGEFAVVLLAVALLRSWVMFKADTSRESVTPNL